jgi:hypothetical protein
MSFYQILLNFILKALISLENNAESAFLELNKAVQGPLRCFGVDGKSLSAWQYFVYGVSGRSMSQMHSFVMSSVI